jgi:hypothetical protein
MIYFSAHHFSAFPSFGRQRQKGRKMGGRKMTDQPVVALGGMI